MSRLPERSVARRRRRSHRAAALAVALLTTAAVVLTGCTGTGTPVSSSTATSTSSTTPTASPTPTPTPAPTLVPDGTARDNLPLFAAVVVKVWKSAGKVSGRAYIDALVAAGFDKKAMQVTQDSSTVGNPAESIQFSVKWDDLCMVGQVGPATGRPVAVLLPVLPQGTCLVGDTRPIDW